MREGGSERIPFRPQGGEVGWNRGTILRGKKGKGEGEKKPFFKKQNVGGD